MTGSPADTDHTVAAELHNSMPILRDASLVAPPTLNSRNSPDPDTTGARGCATMVMITGTSSDSLDTVYDWMVATIPAIIALRRPADDQETTLRARASHEQAGSSRRSR